MRPTPKLVWVMVLHWVDRTIRRSAAIFAALFLLSVPAFASTWLWAWDRAEDLRWLPPQLGVAYFAAQMDVRGEHIAITPRRPPLRVAPATPQLPVVHIEAFHPQHPPTLDNAAVERWANALATTIARLHSPRVQLDFEARLSQRDFYRDVLMALRRQRPTAQLSITALASWCGDADWLNSLPVDEIVPMYFRMGPSERDLWRQRLLHPTPLPPACQAAAGISTDEWQTLSHDRTTAQQALSQRRAVYIFSPKPWRAEMLSGFATLLSAPTASQ